MTPLPETDEASDTPAEPTAIPRLTVAAVARRLGIAPATLRTWDRRYGLGPSAHEPGAHRRYGPEDVARLELMQRELVRGVTPGEAARAARDAALSAVAPVPPTAPLAADDGPLPVTGLASDDLETRVRVGGRVLRMRGAGSRARGVGRAALAMDAATVRRLVDESVVADGLVRTWDEVVRPVLGAVAERWESTGAGVEMEHLVSEAVTTVFGARSLAASRPASDARPVLLAGTPGELHHLPLVALAAVLSERGVPNRPLGANLPVDALVAAVRRTAPAAVVLWAQDPGTADAAVFSALPRTRLRFRSFAAGPGWTGLAPRIGRLETLTGAADALSALLAVPHKN